MDEAPTPAVLRLRQAGQRLRIIGHIGVADDQRLTDGQHRRAVQPVVGQQVGQTGVEAVGDGQQRVAGDDGVDDAAVGLGGGQGRRLVRRR